MFNSAEFFDAHEAWEEVWLESEYPERDFYQGLIQVAAALVHLQRNEYPGLVKLLARSQKLLKGFAPDQASMDLEQFRRAVAAFEQTALSLGEGGIGEIDDSALPRIALTTDHRSLPG